jgi:hypothetical protein
MSSDFAGQAPYYGKAKHFGHADRESGDRRAMSGIDTPRRQPGRIARRTAIAAVLMVVVVGLIYAATPALVARLGPRLATRLGLASLTIEIGYPGLHGVELRRLALANDAFELVANDATVSYSFAGIRSRRLDSVEIGTLEVSRSPAAAAPATRTPDAWQVPTLPVDHLHIEHLTLRSADIGFLGSGHAEIGEGTLSVAIDGLEPAAASRLSLTASLDQSGRYQASFGERGDTTVEFLRMRGLIGSDAIHVDADADLSGYPLALLADMAGLPRGTGSVAAVVHTDIPWPLPESLDWRRLNIGIPTFTVQWRSSRPDLTIDEASGSLAVTNGRVDGSLTGRIVYQAAEGRLELRLPAQHRYTFDGSTLKGTGGPILQIASGTNRLTATLHSYSADDAPDRALTVDADVSASVANVGVEGRAAGELRLPAAHPAGGKGRVTFTGTVAVPGQQREAVVKTDFAFAGRDWHLKGFVSSGIFRDVPFSADLDLGTGRGALSARHHMKLNKPLAASVFPDWAKAWDLDAGDLDAGLQLRWPTPAMPLADVSLRLRDGRAHLDDNTASGISADLQLTWDGASPERGWTLQPTTLQIERIDAGIRIDRMTVGLAFAADALDIDHADAELLGGRAYTGPFTYTVSSGTAAFPLLLADIDLAQVLALEGDDIVATGTLDGTLPVTFSGHVPRVDGGSFRAQPPGGSIHVNPSFTGLTGQPGLDFALLALQDFTYTDLNGEVGYAESGDLKLAIHLKGNNPAVEKGRPIQYNLTINENIPVLLKSLRMSDRVTERIGRDVVN